MISLSPNYVCSQCFEGYMPRGDPLLTNGFGQSRHAGIEFASSICSIMYSLTNYLVCVRCAVFLIREGEGSGFLSNPACHVHAVQLYFCVGFATSTCVMTTPHFCGHAAKGRSRSIARNCINQGHRKAFKSTNFFLVSRTTSRAAAKLDAHFSERGSLVLKYCKKSRTRIRKFCNASSRLIAVCRCHALRLYIW